MISLLKSHDLKDSTIKEIIQQFMEKCIYCEKELKIEECSKCQSKIGDAHLCSIGTVRKVNCSKDSDSYKKYTGFNHPILCNSCTDVGYYDFCYDSDHPRLTTKYCRQCYSYTEYQQWLLDHQSGKIKCNSDEPEICASLIEKQVN